MGRAKGTKNKNHTPITYPRQCPQCEYLASSPATFSYHKQCHDSIPVEQLCDHGCGELARFKGSGGKYRCCEIAQNCVAINARLKHVVTVSWEDNEERKTTARKLFIKSCVSNPLSYKKASETKHKKLLAQDNTSDRRKYNRQVHGLSQRTYRDNISIINPNNVPIGRIEYHLDHKVSKHIGYLLGIPAHFLASVNNLCVLPYYENTGKHSKCSLHPIDLLVMCDASLDIINLIQLKLVQLSDSIEPQLIPNMQPRGRV